MSIDWVEIDNSELSPYFDQDNKLTLNLTNIGIISGEMIEPLKFQTWFAGTKRFLLDRDFISYHPELDDTAEYADLHEDTRLYRKQEFQGQLFRGTLSPVLLEIHELRGNNYLINLWAISVVNDLHFRGCKFFNNLPTEIKYVRKMYTGVLNAVELFKLRHADVFFRNN